MKTILDVRSLCMYFGGLKAVEKVSLYAKQKEIVALIGPNGAGKTTLFNCITGMYTAVAGDVLVSHPDNNTSYSIRKMRPSSITRRGIARTFQNIRLFSDMSVLENVMIGRHCRLKSGIIHAVFRPESTRKEEEKIIEDSFAILQKVGIERYANYIAKNLPYGIQRRLEIARALATDPFLLLLDEPAAGMNPQETDDLCKLITRLRNSEKVTIFLIEHDMNLVMNLAERIYVMDYGELLASGSPAEIRNNPEVIKAYLGDLNYA